MASRHEDPRDHLPLTPAVLHILLALADQERHGYGIMLEVERLTDGRFRPGSGTLYGTIKRLLSARLIAESGERPDPGIDDERRRYYRLTSLGRRVLEAEVARLRQVVGIAKIKHLLPGRATS